jgi:hypothetical protein
MWTILEGENLYEAEEIAEKEHGRKVGNSEEAEDIKETTIDRWLEKEDSLKLIQGEPEEGQSVSPAKQGGEFRIPLENKAVLQEQELQEEVCNTSQPLKRGVTGVKEIDPTLTETIVAEQPEHTHCEGYGQQWFE